MLLALSDLKRSDLVLILLPLDDKLLKGVDYGEFLTVQYGHCVLVADDEDVEGEVVVELLYPAHGQVGDRVLLEVEALEAFGVVLYEDALALGLA